jgi:DAK2 domain fusion protein YloV
VSALPVDDALGAAIVRGDDAVRRTPELLPLLAEAGVVDAGGAGLVEIFRGAHAALTGVPLPDAPAELEELSEEAIHQEQSRYRYCTVFTVEGAALDRRALHDRLERLGDSLLVVGDEQLLKVHVHTDAPEEALALGRAVGVVDEERAEIADMHEQASHREDWLSRLRRATQAPPVQTGLVAVVAGVGNRRIFEERSGIFAIEGGQTMNPSVGEIHEAITALNAEHVIVLPNNPNVRLAAEEAAALSTKDVRVVATRSIPEGVAAVVTFDPDGDVAANEGMLRETLAGVLAAEVTRGARDAVLDGVQIQAGAWLGLVADRAVASDGDLWVVLGAVLDELLADGRSYLTVLRGEDAPALDELRRHIAAHRPELTDDDLQIIEGGQPHYPLLLSAE